MLNPVRVRVPAGALAVLAALALAGAVLVTSPAPATAQVDPEVTPARVEGDTRFHTAANIATLTFEEADEAHLVTGMNFPDALAGSFAAGSVDGPLLLSTREEVPAPTWAALQELGVSRVTLIGGTEAIGESVRQQLAVAGYETDRISGVNRYQTASAVAMRYGQERVGTVAGERTAILATGSSFADALAAGPLSARERLPLFLTPADTTEVSVNRSLQELDIDRIILLGGPLAISEDVEAFYRDRGYAVERIGGPSKMDTAWLTADMSVHDFGFTHELVLLARGDDYPDALAASVHGANLGAPLVLTSTDTELSDTTADWLARTCPDIRAIRALGGTGALSAPVLQEAVDAAESCGETAWASCENPEQGYTVEYPGGWATNAEALGTLGPCSLFDPDPEQIRTAGMQVPQDIAAFLRVDSVDFDRTDPNELFARELDRRETTVDGRQAVRLELEATGEGLRPAGTLTTSWRVRLGENRTFIANTHNVGDLPYEEGQQVLDRMMQTISFQE